MTQKIGIIIENQKGHKELRIFGLKIRSESPDTLFIVQHNTGTFPFLNCPFLGKFKVSRPHMYRDRDIVAVTMDDVDNKKIMAIAQVGRESFIRYALHETPFVVLCILGIMLLALRLSNII